MRRTIISGLLLFAFVSQGMFCTKVTNVPLPVAETKTLLSALSSNFSNSFFYAAVTRTGWDKKLDSSGPYTLFVPNDSAFLTAGIPSVDSVNVMDTSILGPLVRYHIFPGMLHYADIPQAVNTTYSNLPGQKLYFSLPVNGSIAPLTVNGDTVLDLGHEVGNGNIFVIKNILQVPTQTVKQYLLKDTSLSIFVAALQKFGLLDQLDGPGPFTVLALSDSLLNLRGITIDSIRQWDTTRYDPYLFGVYVIPSFLFYCNFFYYPNGGFIISGSKRFYLEAAGSVPGNLPYSGGNNGNPNAFFLGAFINTQPPNFAGEILPYTVAPPLTAFSSPVVGPYLSSTVLLNGLIYNNFPNILILPTNATL